MRSFIIIIIMFSSALLVALALQCSKVALLFLAVLFVSFSVTVVSSGSIQCYWPDPHLTEMHQSFQLHH